MRIAKMGKLFLLSLVLWLGSWLPAMTVLRHLEELLSFDPTFSAIFAQIAHAPMTPGVWIPLPMALGATALVLRLWEKKAMRVAAVLWGVFAFVCLFAVHVLLTRVNGVVFCDVLLSLLDVLEKGGL